MRPTWLIEAGVYGDEAGPLLAEIRRQGMAAEVLPFRALLKEKDIVAGRTLVAGDCVVAYGTFPFARQIQFHRPWTPGAWCDPNNLDCSCYYGHFGKYLLNRRLVVAGDGVVAVSRYAAEGARSVEAGCPDEVRSFAEVVLAEVRWRPDPVFMVDVCEAEGGLRLVELSGFSCSWLYACDPAAVVAAAAERAEAGWEVPA